MLLRFFGNGIGKLYKFINNKLISAHDSFWIRLTSNHINLWPIILIVSGIFFVLCFVLGNDTEHPVILTIISIVLPPILSGWFVRKLIFITKIGNSLSIETHRYHEPVLRSGNKSDDKNS